MFSSIKSYLKFFLRKIKSDPYIIANWRFIDDNCVIADKIFEAFLVKIVSEDQGAIFVQVGANTGVGKHDLYDTIKRWCVKSFLIEPQPDVFMQLKENYQQFPYVEVINVALENKNSIKSLYRFSPYANQFNANRKEFGNGIVSFSKEHVVKYYLENATAEGKQQDLSKILEVLEVRCVTFPDLAKEVQLNRIDVLMIDTEGYDYEILKMIINASFTPILIRYEHKHLGKDKIQAWELLKKQSYKIILDHKNGDTIGIRI